MYTVTYLISCFSHEDIKDNVNNVNNTWKRILNTESICGQWQGFKSTPHKINQMVLDLISLVIVFQKLFQIFRFLHGNFKMLLEKENINIGEVRPQ